MQARAFLGLMVLHAKKDIVEPRHRLNDIRRLFQDHAFGPLADGRVDDFRARWLTFLHQRFNNSRAQMTSMWPASQSQRISSSHLGSFELTLHRHDAARDDHARRILSHCCQQEIWQTFERLPCLFSNSKGGLLAMQCRRSILDRYLTILDFSRDGGRRRARQRLSANEDHLR